MTALFLMFVGDAPVLLALMLKKWSDTRHERVA
ncbi:MAG: hypothetical protein QOI46_1896 [Alphaproteobacteria bacterium]|jgi:hypothetical protein|nr:hypothetical protein [Alphaproteobacteria bacterium]MEA2971405.1 hypothetical protein [Alphaproteobacteria bacterium]